MGPLLVNIDVILLLLLLTVATLVGVCGSRGTGLVPLSDGKFAFLTTQKAEFLHNAKNFPKSGPEMAPEAEAAMPPKLQVVSHTKPPASSPDQLLSGQRHSIVGSPSTQSPRIWFGPGPATLPTWSSPAITHGQINSAPALCPLEAPARILPAQHSHIRGLAPISSPKSPNATVPTDVASPPLIPNLKPGERKQAQLPVLSSMGSLPHSRRIGASSPLHTPMHSNFPSSHQGPSIPPLASIENHSSAASHKEKRRHVSSPIPGPHPSFPVHPPFPITAGPIHAFAPSPTAFSSPFETGVPPHSGVFPFAPAPRSQPSRVLSPAPAPKPRHAQALPPPPSNLDCSSLSCMEPLTYSPPVSPCACVQPMKVSLRLGVELYTFFPLVSELAQEIASGTFLKQSQVRIMGANAGSEQPEKTIVLIDLVPFGERFGNSIAFYLYERFWQKQVKIRMTYFGDYDVLYINYPGLPPPPPMSPSNVNVGNGRFGRKNNSRTEHPLGVDVGRRKEKLADSMIAIVVLSSVIALVLCAGVGWLFILKRNRQSCLPSQSQSIATPFVKVPGIGPTLYGSGCCSTSGSLSSSMATYSAKTFSAVEIEKATNKFDDANIIGEGGFGRVYLGVLEDGIQVAVKVLKREDQQGSREFLSEVEMLSRLHHRNLVKLIGICTEEHLRCLVYELIPNGSVESHLHGVDKETSPLDWSARMKIALGSARGLAYLHEDSNPRVIHRDFKSSNILLEHNFTAKVSDFGLARTAKEEGKEHISTRVMGTFGYVAPEYAMTGHLLVKSDVYSYGVVLLELLTGRKPVDMLRAPGQENLVSWARPLLTTREGLETLIDPAMGSDVPLDSVAKVAAIASMCIQSEVSHRPFMGEVVQALKLVCSEHDEHHASESGSCDDLSKHDTDIKSNGGLASETERVLSASEIFSMPMGLARNASDSFRRLSSSGPLKTTKKSNFWRRVRGLSRRSVSKHGP